jgi:putative ABC transport system substrate-binding protein
MTRRVFAYVLCLLALAASSSAGAQAAKKVPRIGYLAGVSAAADAPRLDAFRAGLRELGYVEGQSIQVEYRHESLDLSVCPSMRRSSCG